jgi:hypothetical protein
MTSSTKTLKFAAIVYDASGTRFDGRGFVSEQERDEWMTIAKNRYPTTFSIVPAILPL